MTTDFLSLKWNNHKSTFIHVLSSVRSKEAYCDVTLACDGRFYSLHKFVLSTCSEYFEEIFGRTQCKHPVIVLKDIKFQDLEALLNYMYVGEVKIAKENLSSLINAAECLKIKGLALPDEDPLDNLQNKGRQHRKRSRRTVNRSATKRRKKDSFNVCEDINSLARSLPSDKSRDHQNRKLPKTNIASSDEETKHNGTIEADIEMPPNFPIKVKRVTLSSNSRVNSPSSNQKKPYAPEEVTSVDDCIKVEAIDFDIVEGREDDNYVLPEGHVFVMSEFVGVDNNYEGDDSSMLSEQQRNMDDFGAQDIPGSSGFHAATSWASAAAPKMSTSLLDSPPDDASQVMAATELQQLLATISECEKKIREQSLLLQELQALSSSCSCQQDDQYEELRSMLPVPTMDHFNGLEAQIRSEECFKKQLLKRLQVIGGTTLKASVKYLIDATLANEVQLQFNWEGKIGWKTKDNQVKRAFKVTQLCQLITKVILSKTGLLSTEKEIGTTIQIYLRNAADRCGGRMKRQAAERSKPMQHSSQARDDLLAMTDITFH